MGGDMQLGIGSDALERDMAERALARHAGDRSVDRPREPLIPSITARSQEAVPLFVAHTGAFLTECDLCYTNATLSSTRLNNSGAHDDGSYNVMRRLFLIIGSMSVQEPYSNRLES
jgi:hypothetical protein